MKRRILIADDQRHVLRVMSQALERQGYQVEGVLNGELALKRVREQHPDVLITDIEMPRMTGEELCRQIQAEMPDREFLIFVITSRTELEHREWSSSIDTAALEYWLGKPNGCPLTNKSSNNESTFRYRYTELFSSKPSTLV